MNKVTKTFALVLVVLLVFAAGATVVLAGSGATPAEEQPDIPLPGEGEGDKPEPTPEPEKPVETPEPTPDPTPPPTEQPTQQPTEQPQQTQPQATQGTGGGTVDTGNGGGKEQSSKNMHATFLDEAGDPVKGMQVAAGVEGVALNIKKTTNEKGEITVNGVPYGTGTLTFDREGIRPLTISLQKAVQTGIASSTDDGVSVNAAAGAKNISLTFQQQGDRFVLKEAVEQSLFGGSNLPQMILLLVIIVVVVIVLIAVARHMSHKKRMQEQQRRYDTPADRAPNYEDYVAPRQTGGQSKLNKDPEDKPDVKFGDRSRM